MVGEVGPKTKKRKKRNQTPKKFENQHKVCTTCHNMKFGSEMQVADFWLHDDVHVSHFLAITSKIRHVTLY